jgi:CubicO group peptidase (beta-lactamase class C family)
MKTLLAFLLFFLSAQTRAQDFSIVDSTINAAICDSIFPGATVLIGDAKGTLFKNAYGNFTYEKSSPKVKNNTIYDLASVTKAFGTNFCVMKLVDEGKLDINKPVSFYLPEFAVNGKEDVKVVDLLIHESGLQAYYPPKKDEDRTHILDAIKALSLNYETGFKTKYSCLNFITTMMVVESIVKEPMYKFYEDNFVTPLNMNRTFFTPKDEIKELCAPTTLTLQGVVHDPLARGLEGLSGNAGLFSTTEDLSKLCQILLNKGIYDDKIYLSDSVISTFSKKYSPQSTRAIGFDTRSAEGYSSSGQYFSNGTYGHLGYTGTSIWIDPVRKIYAIFLTNRVYPDDKKYIGKTRSDVYDSVILALEKK